VSARRTAVGWGNESSADTEEALFAEMVRTYTNETGLKVRALIIPALDVFSLKHRILESTLFDLARNSAAVPSDRASLIAKGLFFWI
jgi:hypothetical protein